MTCFVVPVSAVLTRQRGGDDPCYAYAVRELARLLGRLGVGVREAVAAAGEGFCLRLSAESAGGGAPAADGLRGDCYVLRILPEEAQIVAAGAKGVLNGVYDLAERMGIAFVLPGEAGELLPGGGRPLPLPEGEWRMIPRFPYRGVFAQLECARDYPAEEWLRFYAKLRFNAVSHRIESRSLARELGLRLEVGGHGLAHLLPRERFAAEPELFRMFQPDDFGGKRQNDSNFCPTHPGAKRTVQEHFRAELQRSAGAHAIHAWADDLPAGGWCLCPSCRALPPTDQAMLAMRHLAAAAAEAGSPVRVPVLAYHDTMFPGTQIDAPKESFLLFAPRERCYGHAIDDPACPRNRHYYAALQQWRGKFAGIDDAHTFEYYFDQILFRGLYPFLPEIILADMRAYERAGIECHLSLQVAGPEIAPEFNLLVFARGLWDPALTAAEAVAGIARSLCAGEPAAEPEWVRYLTRRAGLFTDAMRMCGHNLDIYLDYRWLPETTHPFGAEIAQTYRRCAGELQAAAGAFAGAAPGRPALRDLRDKEVRRARFEAAELEVMGAQQQAMNELAAYHNGGGVEPLRRAAAAMRAAIAGFARARPLAHAAGIGEDTWYCKNINTWITRELERKLALFAPEAAGGA